MINRHNVFPQGAGGGFSLIELLIVVMIITILASIAVPNFLEAQTRSKVTRVKADMRTLILAVESYQMDHEAYPVRRNTLAIGSGQIQVPEVVERVRQMSVLTSPIAYLTSLPPDIFETQLQWPNNLIDYYDPTQASWLINSRRGSHHMEPSQAGWLLVSVGPDGYLGLTTPKYGWPSIEAMRASIFFVYDPTNGTVSTGNIYAGQIGGIGDAAAIFTERNTEVFN